jgi:hypothetical protein
MRYQDEGGWPEERPPRGGAAEAEGEGAFGDDRDDQDPGAIRAEDTEPYVGLQYIARLFKIVAMIVIVAIVAEIVAGLATEGTAAILPLMSEVIQGGVLAAMLWGVGDLTLLFIDVGHDMRAARVLLGRLSARLGAAEFAPRSAARHPAPAVRPRPSAHPPGDPRAPTRSRTEGEPAPGMDPRRPDDRPPPHDPR